MRAALHTRVRLDGIEQYEDARRAVPAELTETIRGAGVTAWTIWRSGTDLFHVIDCASYPALLANLEKLPVKRRLAGRMAELLDVVHDYSEVGAGAGLPVVWQL